MLTATAPPPRRQRDAERDCVRPTSSDALYEQFRRAIPLTKDGRIKSRNTFDEQIWIIDPLSTPDETAARIKVVMDVFAFYRWRPGLTRTSDERLGEWFTRKKGGLYVNDVVRHLLAGRLAPALNPQWVAPRSFGKAKYFCLDVDLHIRPEADAARIAGLTEDFDRRCGYVEDALRLMGLDPTNPWHVLVQPTPSGGRHYYVFLDGVHHTDTITRVLDEMGLRHTPGSIEIYPRENCCLRLPFGHVPDQQHDPTRWIRFADDYRCNRVRRSSLQTLFETYEQHYHRRRQNTPKPTPPRADSPPSLTPSRSSQRIGLPKRFRLTAPAPVPGQDPASRYAALQRDGVRSTQDADELWQLGIQTYGSRLWALKQLAMHLVWFKRLPAAEAAEKLTEWAMNPRHQSRTIQADLATGKGETARQVRELCAWSETHRHHGTEPLPSGPRYARAELVHLTDVLNRCPRPDREAQAAFYLKFLWFAKAHGTAAEDRSGWEAAPAVKEVVRRWPGCNRMAYRVRMTTAEEAGVFGMVKEKWQNPRGKGRARTYRLTVPVIHPAEWVIDEKAALEWLVTGKPPVSPEATTPGIAQDPDTHAPEGKRDDERGTIRGPGRDQADRADTIAVSEAGARGRVDQGPRERPPQPDAAEGLPALADVELDPVPEPAEEQWELSEPDAVCTVVGGGERAFRRLLQSARENRRSPG